MVLALQALVAIAVVIYLGHYVSEEWTRSLCNEDVNHTPGTKINSGCTFLTDRGYDLIKIVPALVMAAFAAAGLWKGRRWLIWTGFAVALVLLLLAGFVEPSNYPWSEGTDR